MVWQEMNLHGTPSRTHRLSLLNAIYSIVSLLFGLEIGPTVTFTGYPMHVYTVLSPLSWKEPPCLQLI